MFELTYHVYSITQRLVLDGRTSTFAKFILCSNEIPEAFKVFCIKCLGTILSWIQVWCKQFKGDRKCDNFCLLIGLPIRIGDFKDKIYFDCRG